MSIWRHDNGLFQQVAMKPRKSEVPPGGLIQNYLPADYADAYRYEVDCNNELFPDDIMISFWTDLPRWVEVLFKVRNFLVRFVGLETSQERNLDGFIQCIRCGASYGIASVQAKNRDETVLLLADKHLDAYLAIHIAGDENVKKISVVTLVNFKNTLGRMYFFLIRPFHGLVVKSMLKRATAKNVMAR